MCYLTRIDPQHNQKRFYLIEVGPTLIGEHCLIRIHGRLGAWSKPLPPIPYSTEAEAIQAADKLLQKRLRRGYRIVWNHQLTTANIVESSVGQSP